MFGPEDGWQGYTAGEGHLIALTERIVSAAGPELARRRQEDSLLFVLAQWSKPIISAAAVLVVVAGSILGIHRRGTSDDETQAVTLAEVLIPQELAPWYYPENETTLMEIVSALEGGS